MDKIFFINIPYRLHAVSRTQQGKQREPSVKTLRSPLSAEFWRHCVLSGRIQRRSTPERRNGNINLSKYFISSSGDRTHNQSVLQSHLVPLRHDLLIQLRIFRFCINQRLRPNNVFIIHKTSPRKSVPSYL